MRSSFRLRAVLIAAVITILSGLTPLSVTSPRALGLSTPVLPSGFADEIILSGLSHPTAFAWAADGRLFVAEKSGIIKVFATPSSPAKIFADLRTQVHNYWDRGLMGLTLDPAFTTGRPYVYITYAADALIGETAPRWGTAGTDNDPCPNPPGSTVDGCVVSGRLSRLTAAGDTMTGSELVLISGWCQQFPSHSNDHVAFGPDGYLYVSAGDGASFSANDYGQFGGTRPDTTNPLIPKNPCGDPPGGVSGTMTAPTAEGGSLRAQSLRRSGGVTLLNGTILRVDPDTGAGAPTNPYASSSNVNKRRIVAYGLRNPFRFIFRPGTNELWLGDVGNTRWEELDLITNPTTLTAAPNFGWPCYEGAGQQASYAAIGLTSCTNLYAAGASAVAAPYWSYYHGVDPAVSGDACAGGNASIVAGAFYTGGRYPAAYADGLFLGDYSRRCLWFMPKGANGRPDASKITPFGSGMGFPVFFGTQPGTGDIVYANFDEGSIHRIHYYPDNRPPTARVVVTPAFGIAPLTVALDASTSSDPDELDSLSYSWDLNGDGTFGDATGVTASTTYTVDGIYRPAVRATDTHGLTSTASAEVAVGNRPPVVTIDTPTTALRWTVGDSVNFSAHATDPEDGTLTNAAFTWNLAMVHCPAGCHTHPITGGVGSSGSFEAPAHEYPSHLQLSLTVTDSGGLSATATRDLDPATIQITLASSPTGIGPLALGDSSGPAPLSATFIRGTPASIAAPTGDVVLGESVYRFNAWSDAGAAAHEVSPLTNTTLTAAFDKVGTTDAPSTCATAATTPMGVWTSGFFGTSTDQDWSKFTLSAAGWVRIQLGDVRSSTRIELRSSCSKVIATSSGSGARQIYRHLPAGTYRVMAATNGSVTVDPYALRIARIANGVHLLSSSLSLSGRTVSFVGELVNNSTKRRAPAVRLRFYDDEGGYLGTKLIAADLLRIAPGGHRSPIHWIGNAPTGTARITKTIERPRSSATIRRPTVVLTSVGRDDSGWWTMSGTVRNKYSRTIHGVRVSLVLYDARGDISADIQVSPSRTKLRPGQTATFTGRFVPSTPTPARSAARARAN